MMFPRNNEVKVALALLATGCNWTTFDDLVDEAAIRVYDAPDGYRKTGFGSVVTSLELDPGTAEASSRFMASAGSDSPIVFRTVWANDAPSNSSSMRCDKKSDCAKGNGVGSALIPFPLWAADTPRPMRGCVLAPALPNFYVFCESATSTNHNRKFEIDDVLAEKTSVRFSGAGLPERHPLGVALIGAHAIRDLTGAPINGTLFYQPDFLGKDTGEIPPNRRLDLVDPGTQRPFAEGEAAGDYGYAVAVHPLSTSELMIAVSQPSHNRVIVAVYDEKLEPPEGMSQAAQHSFRARTRACIESPDASLKGFGKVLALGDINDDGLPELFTGIDPTDGLNGKKQSLYMYPGTGLPAFDAETTQCPPWGEAPVDVACSDGPCSGSGFGAALAVGDVDGDLFNDLIVGAPLADIDGLTDAGTVWIIPGSKDSGDTRGLDFSRMTHLSASSQKDHGRLGASVAALRTRGRHEPVAGAPGEDQVYVFMCTKLEDFAPSTKCLPETLVKPMPRRKGP